MVWVGGQALEEGRVLVGLEGGVELLVLGHFVGGDCAIYRCLILNLTLTVFFDITPSSQDILYCCCHLSLSTSLSLRIRLSPRPRPRLFLLLLRFLDLLSRLLHRQNLEIKVPLLLGPQILENILAFPVLEGEREPLGAHDPDLMVRVLAVVAEDVLVFLPIATSHNQDLHLITVEVRRKKVSFTDQWCTRRRGIGREAAVVL